MQRGNYGPAFPQQASRSRQAPPMIPNPMAGQNAQQLAALQAARMEADKKKEEAKNRSQKPVDRNLPDGIADAVVGDGPERYNLMRNLERKLDTVMMRKRLDVKESVYCDAKQFGTLRIWISNTVEHQPWQYSGMDTNAYDFTSGVEATFRLKIEGRLLPDADDDAVELDDGQKPPSDQYPRASDDDERASKRPKLTPKPASAAPSKLSHFFKAISIDFDRPRALQPDGYNRIEWKRPDISQANAADLPAEADFDRLEFERKADENINIVINLVRDDHPERYRLAPALAELLDMEDADRQTVLMGIWEYIKLAGVRMDDDKRQIYCDHRLQAIFGSEVILFQNLRDAIRPHMTDLPPLSLKYTIRVDKAFHTTDPQPNYTIYDIPVPVSSPLLKSLKNLTHQPSHTETLKKIVNVDDQIALIMQKMNESKAKHDFFTNMSADPARFIERWISSQKRDLDVIMGAGSWSDEDWQGAEWRKGGREGIWGSREAIESVSSWLARPRA